MREPELISSGGRRPLSDAKQLSENVLEAAELRQQILRLEFDQRASVDGWQVLYAVDTNIVYLYLPPDDSTTRTDFGAVFKDDPEEIKEAISGAVSHYLFDNAASSNVPLLLLPGHDIEVRTYYDRTSNEAAVESVSLANISAEVVSFLEHARSANDPAEVEALLDYARDELRRFLYETKSPTERQRLFNSLLRNQSILRLEAAAQHNAFKDLQISIGPRREWHPFRFSNDLTTTVEEAVLRRNWHKALRKLGKTHGVANDAQALGKLQFLNRYLASKRVRLVLITGDTAIHTAADKLHLSDVELASLDDNGWGAPNRRPKFGDIFVRHPRAFLSKPEVITPVIELAADQEHRPQVDWLDSFLAQYSRRKAPQLENVFEALSVNRKDRERNASQFLKRHPDARDRLKADWRDYTEELVRAHSSVSSIARTAIERHTPKSMSGHQVKESLSSLEDQLRDEIEDSWNRFFDTIYETGYNLIGFRETESDPYFVRSAPPLVFIDFPEIAPFAEQVCARSYQGNVEYQENNFHKVVPREKDPTGYVQALYFALLFAYTERWHVASALAQRAIDKLSLAVKSRQYIDIVPSKISGREAYYLRAFLLRVQATSSEDIVRAKALLEDAEEARLDDGSADEASPPSTGLRFKAEQANLDITSIILEVLGYEREGRNARELRDDVESAIHEARMILDKADECGLGWVVKQVKRELLTHVFMGFFICEQMDYSAPVTREQVSDLANTFCSVMPESESEDALRTSNLEFASFLYAVTRWLPDYPIAPFMLDRLRDIRSKIASTGEVYRYDEEILAMLVDDVTAFLVRRS